MSRFPEFMSGFSFGAIAMVIVTAVLHINYSMQLADHCRDYGQYVTKEWVLTCAPRGK